MEGLGHLFAESEQVQLLAQLAVVPLTRLFEKLQVLRELCLLREGDAVNPGQLLLALIAFPVGAGHGQAA